MSEGLPRDPATVPLATHPVPQGPRGKGGEVVPGSQLVGSRISVWVSTYIICIFCAFGGPLGTRPACCGPPAASLGPV